MLALQNQPLFLDPAAWASASAALARLLDGSKPSGPPAAAHTVEGATVRLEVSGVIIKGVGGSLPGWWADLDDLHAAAEASVRLALADPGQPATLVLRVESGGGYITGLPEAARAVDRARRAGVQVIAHTEDLCASAAYWIASCADVVSAAPSSRVGSIGAYTLIDDLTGRFEAAGVERHVFRSGTLKAMGLPGKEVTEEEKDYLRQGIAESAEMFFSHVRARRGSSVPAEVFETAAVYTGERALALGLVDILEDTESHMIRALALTS